MKPRSEIFNMLHTIACLKGWMVEQSDDVIRLLNGNNHAFHNKGPFRVRSMIEAWEVIEKDTGTVQIEYHFYQVDGGISGIVKTSTIVDPLWVRVFLESN